MKYVRGPKIKTSLGPNNSLSSPGYRYRLRVIGAPLSYFHMVYKFYIPCESKTGVPSTLNQYNTCTCIKCAWGKMIEMYQYTVYSDDLRQPLHTL